MESQLVSAKDEAARRQLLLDFPSAVTVELARRLCAEVSARMHVDIGTAARYADAAHTVARQLPDRRAYAEALRMRGHVSYLTGNYRRAAGAYRKALRILDRLGEHVDAGRTRSSALQTLIYLGRYEEALEWAERAREIFQREGDSLRLARLDSNIGNILHRRDRHEEALELYQRAIAGLKENGDYPSAAIAMRNMAVCHAAVHDFDRALQAYQEARLFYRDQGLTLLMAEVNDNIANLYYLRGEYAQAVGLYRRSDVEERGNTYHAAIAKLDQSDLYLELNLYAEAARFAGDAAGRFAGLGMRYEQAKSLVNLGLASFRAGESGNVLPVLNRARALFGREKNSAWQATADFHRAAVFLELGQIGKAREVALGALRALDASLLPGKAILCALLLANIELLANDASRARRHCDQARAYLHNAATAPLSFHFCIASGRVAEAEGDPHAAAAAYREAHRILEVLRGQIPHGDLRIAFLEDKHLVYENLVRLAVTGAVHTPVEELLKYVEHAKSRSLAESMTLSTRARSVATGERFAETEALQAVRRRLAWYYRQLDRAESDKRSPQSGPMRDLRERIVQCEEELAAALTASRTARAVEAPLADTGEAQASRIQAVLPQETALLDYYAAGGRLHLFVVTPTQIRHVPLGPLDEVVRTGRLLGFQMSRNLSASPGPASGDPAWLAATRGHLESLYRALIEPAHPWLPNGHWVVVPHGPLHRLPFHAMHDGDAHVIDRRTVSYAPSAMVYRLCMEKEPAWAGHSTVVGVSDERAPDIAREVESVAGFLQPARLLTGSSATAEALRRAAATSRFIHLATHGIFRQDNPLFSSIRMGDSRLCVFDLYDFDFAAELITLSGCATGVQETVGAGEVMGLARGLLHAGAHTVHLSLWEVNDRSTAEYMGRFYGKIGSGRGVCQALREAMLETRERYPHPYYWAPFAVTGRSQRTFQDIFPAGSGDPI